MKRLISPFAFLPAPATPATLAALAALAALTLLAVFYPAALKAATETTPMAAPGAPFKVAVVEFNPELNNLDDNLPKLAKALEEAAAAGAKLIVGPEMSTTGYAYVDRQAIAPYVDTIPGKATKTLIEIAAKHKAYIVVGLAEKNPETDLYYNSSVLVGPEGIVGVYRKSHQWETEEHWSSWGDLGVPVFDTELGRIAINICFDSAFFEPPRLAALGGADIQAFPTNSTSQAVWALQARALQNGYYVLSANRSNTELDFSMIGASAIWSPEGKLLAEAPLIKSKDQDVNDPTIIYAEIDPKLYDNAAKARLNRRRPELYADLMLKISPWDYKASTEPKEVSALTLQYAPLADPAQALAKIEELILAELKNGPVDLVVLPEYALTGPPKDATQAASLAASWAEAANGPNITRLKDLAKKNAFHLAFGFIEKDGQNLYSTVALLGPDGHALGLYRKTHLLETELAWATPGDAFIIVSTPLGKIGLMSGGEELFPEVAGILTVKRADLIVLPAAWDLSYGATLAANLEMTKNPYPPFASSLWDSVALSSQAYTLVANFSGGDKNFAGAGGLYALDPLYGLDQTSLPQQNLETAHRVKFTTLAKDWWFNQGHVAAMRRPEMYLPLIKKPTPQGNAK
ncbi:MAG: nitrilase [Deltaproteobacteria bacterium]|jgi:predicted amidohydrolase|nr:nitrilase [Deltaproteobacteria bacterium]